MNKSKDEDLGRCPVCDKDMNLVGRAHNCRDPLDEHHQKFIEGCIDEDGPIPEEAFKRAVTKRLKPKAPGTVRSPLPPERDRDLAEVPVIRGQGSMKGKLVVDPDIDMTKPIYEQVLKKRGRPKTSTLDRKEQQRLSAARRRAKKRAE